MAYVHGREVEAAFRNNIFIATGAAILLRVSQPHDRIRFENNLYWREHGPVQIVWDNQTYSNLGEWQDHTGQELVNGRPSGLVEPPALTRHPRNVRAGKHIGLPMLRAFRPRANSPATAGGLDLRQMFGLDVGRRDFLGAALPNSGRLPVGAIGGRIEK